MGKLLVNIKTLYGVENSISILKKGSALSELNSIDSAWLMVEGDSIAGFGKMSDVPSYTGHEVEDVTGHSVMPAYCDSHTHLVFAQPRNLEFEDRIRGLSYEEIANRGGGILNSAAKLNEMSEDELFEVSKQRLVQVIKSGTGAIEIKSGYGLSNEGELKMLRVIKRLKELNWIPIKSTFLGAHALPSEFKNDKAGYLKIVTEELLPEVAKQGLADYIDIFCEKGYFDVKDTELILQKGLEFGMKGKIHVNQFNAIGGVQVGVDNKALSVDHLELVEEDDIEALETSNTISTLLPSCSFFLSIPYAPVRSLLHAGLPVALASDYNPGSTPTGNMNFVFSLACIKMKMLPEEALNACTINGAFAMELEEKVGSISKAKLANVILTKKIPSLSYLPYAFGESNVEKVMINGSWFNQ